METKKRPNPTYTERRILPSGFARTESYIINIYNHGLPDGINKQVVISRNVDPRFANYDDDRHSFTLSLRNDGKVYIYAADAVPVDIEHLQEFSQEFTGAISKGLKMLFQEGES